jgi:acetylornithine/succinyldiaminopimelate/putrescine aminotransferase
LIGIETTVPAERVSDALLERGVAAKDTRDFVLRIAPPLVIDDDATTYLLKTFSEALGAVDAQA